jgi:glutamine amidotransferase
VIALIDYGAGNLTSVKKALAATDADVFVPQTADDLTKAQAIIVPGVGHFSATRVLDDVWLTAIRDLVGQGRPLLGICLGLQWLFEGSEEAPELPGLGALEGRCYRLTGSGSIKIPHVGWNALNLTRKASIVEGIPTGSQVYFTHSYVAPVTDDTVAITEHGEAFAAAVQRGRIAGVQFHPEKSGEVGLQILRNFLALVDQPARGSGAGEAGGIGESGRAGVFPASPTSPASPTRPV